MEPGRFIYFIRPVGRDGPVKIGSARDPDARIYSLMTWSPFPLEVVASIPGDYPLERKLHCTFAKSHSHREWFLATPRLLKLIADLKAGVPVEQAINLDIKEGSIRAPNQRVWSDAQKLRQSFQMRFFHMNRRLNVMLPERAHRLLWSIGDKYTPTNDERLYLESILADPLKYCEQRVPA